MTAAQRSTCCAASESPSTREHDLAQRRRHRGAVVVVDGQELFGEEHVAVGAEERALDQVGRRLSADDRRDELADLVAIEAGEIDPLDRAGAVELGEQGTQRMAAVEVVGSVGTDEHHRRAAEAAGEIHEQLARRTVGPVQILEHEQRRYAFGQPLEHAEQLFEQRAGDDAFARRRVELGQQAPRARRVPDRRPRRASRRRACGAACASPARSDRTAARGRRGRSTGRRAPATARECARRARRRAATCRRPPRRPGARWRRARRRPPPSSSPRAASARRGDRRTGSSKRGRARRSVWSSPRSGRQPDSDALTASRRRGPRCARRTAAAVELGRRLHPEQTTPPAPGGAREPTDRGLALTLLEPAVHQLSHDLGVVEHDALLPVGTGSWSG